MIPETWLADLLVLKRIRRSGWLAVGIPQPESIADHTFSTALLARRIARGLPGIDANRVLLMALLHDFHEARLSDIPTPAKAYLPDGAIEEAERRIVDEQWPDDDEAVAVLHEFLAGETEEAKLVQAVDHLEFLVQADAYRRAGHRLTEKMLRRGAGGPARTHPATREMAEKLIGGIE